MKILIIRVSSIGDVIHTLPAFFLLRTCLPDASFSWIVQKKAASLLVGQPYLDNIWMIPDNYLMPTNIITTLSTINEIKKHQWDTIVDFQGLLKTSLLITRLYGKKYGFDWAHAREKCSTFWTDHHTTPLYTNIIQKNLALASDVISHVTSQLSQPTIDVLKKHFYLHSTPETIEIVDAWIKKYNLKNIIAVCPNTTWESKRWPMLHWQKLLHLLEQHYPDYSIILIGKDFGADAEQLAAYAQKHNIKVHAAPAWSLATTSYLLQKTGLLIAPDTSFLHIADFLGVPSIGLFGPTLKERHGAFITSLNMTLALQAPCPHRYQKKHSPPSKTMPDCMALITPLMVMEHIHKALSHKKNSI